MVNQEFSKQKSRKSYFMILGESYGFWSGLLSVEIGIFSLKEGLNMEKNC